MKPALRLGVVGFSVLTLLGPGSLGRANVSRAGGSAETVPDLRLGVTWLADANLARKKTFGVSGINHDGSMDYQTAQRWVRAMDRRAYLGHRNWTLPTTPVSQPGCESHNKQSAFGFGCSESPLPTLYSTILGLSAPDTAVPITDGTDGPFTNLQPYLYWTGTAAVDSAQGYRTFSFNTGWAGSNVAKHNMYALPLIEGNPFGTAGRAPGLYPSSDGKTVYDPALNVTWLADADLAASQAFGVSGIDRDGSMQQQTAVDWVNAMNAAGWLGQSDWQLPTVTSNCGGFNCTRGNPLSELYYLGLHLVAGDPVVTAPNRTRFGFKDIQPYLYWSCEGATAQGVCKGRPAKGMAWSFSFGNGFEGTDLDQNDLYVLVYYPSPLITKSHPTCGKNGIAITCS